MAHLLHVQVGIVRWWGVDRVVKARHDFEKECMISHDKRSRVQVWSKGPETWHGEVIGGLDVSISLVRNKSQIWENLWWIERKGTWGNCYNLWVQGVHWWREEVIQKRKGEWRVDFQKPLGITVYIVRRRNRRRDSRAREVMVLKWEEMESQAGARAKRWKEDVSGEVTLDLVDLY